MVTWVSQGASRVCSVSWPIGMCMRSWRLGAQADTKGSSMAGEMALSSVLSSVSAGKLFSESALINGSEYCAWMRSDVS